MSTKNIHEIKSIKEETRAESDESTIPNNSTSLSNPNCYFMSIGTTTCRVFEVLSNHKLNQIILEPYTIQDPENPDYLPHVINHVRYNILPNIPGYPKLPFIKVFVDSNFNEIFAHNDDPSIAKDFMNDFYKLTGLCFNILTVAQTNANMKRVLGYIPSNSAIINIHSQGVDILQFFESSFIMHDVPITLDNVKTFIKESSFNESWSEVEIKQIKKFIAKKIGSVLNGVTIENAFIIKDELSFMQNMGYQLKSENNLLRISFTRYKKQNRELLFNANYAQMLVENEMDAAHISRLHGFKIGHIIIETLLDLMKTKYLIPKNEHSIHGSGSDTYTSYIFNVVLSGSTHEGRGDYIVEASKHFSKMGINILSPAINKKNRFKTITATTEYNHLSAIDECDLLFVCNKGSNAYIGEATKCEIYYAYALKKPIAFWKSPAEDEFLSFIPKECWNKIMPTDK